ncbi:hypothetical protein [Haladaptatus salinisoli]|uniref:hypothetical protein n=1 Tax=Haladaptatus salinisoli TaxID=2884876 RepID=UPI001D0AE855|nr:hypothetical protein [Haladaptatus salinisoli]
MKSGASDPFADDASDQSGADESAESSASETPSGTPTADESHADAAKPTEKDTQDGSLTEQSDESVTRDSNTHQISRADLPLTLRRDNVKDERENVHQLFVQDDTDNRAKDAERDLESMIGEDVYRLDAREAIYLAGMRNLNDAATILREWGYDL